MAQDELRALRIAINKGDYNSLVQILSNAPASDVLQLVGNSLAAATGEGVTGAKELAGAWCNALRERGWAGDDELAVEMEAASGHPSSSGREGAGGRPG